MIYVAELKLAAIPKREIHAGGFAEPLLGQDLRYKYLSKTMLAGRPSFLTKAELMAMLNATIAKESLKGRPKSII